VAQAAGLPASPQATEPVAPHHRPAPQPAPAT
jgi:hypothetical protein